MQIKDYNSSDGFMLGFHQSNKVFCYDPKSKQTQMKQITVLDKLEQGNRIIQVADDLFITNQYQIISLKNVFGANTTQASQGLEKINTINEHQFHSICAKDQIIYLISGYATSKVEHDVAVECFNIQSKKLDQLQWIPLQIHSAAADFIDDNMYVLGGYNGLKLSTLDSIQVFNSITNNWKISSTIMPSKCSELECCYLQQLDSLFVFRYIKGNLLFDGKSFTSHGKGLKASRFLPNRSFAVQNSQQIYAADESNQFFLYDMHLAD